MGSILPDAYNDLTFGEPLPLDRARFEEALLSYLR
jgi:hypothetical protein